MLCDKFAVFKLFEQLALMLFINIIKFKYISAPEEITAVLIYFLYYLISSLLNNVRELNRLKDSLKECIR